MKITRCSGMVIEVETHISGMGLSYAYFVDEMPPADSTKCKAYEDEIVKKILEDFAGTNETVDKIYFDDVEGCPIYER